ncbi:uncharacterized protein FFB20_14730 [Fusarium fujikuroi]|nr:uncharacterized protein FFE2_02927 [Fusarium fujikuroi]SCO04912.1 uncharacterized protein FFC1_09806 [Fusarium fujikuroi]SCO15384.1 uncharacterized protein FFB20_14730 [Fusarium fujikuroi]
MPNWAEQRLGPPSQITRAMICMQLCDRDRLAAFAKLSMIVISFARTNICTFFVDLAELPLEPTRNSLIWTRGAAGGQSESPVLAPISQCTGAKDQKMPG